MASEAEWALGDEIRIGDGATPTEAFTEIPELRNIAFNRGTRTKVDTTHHQSIAPYRDNIATFLENGQITAEGNFLPSNAVHMSLETKLADDTPTTFQYVIHAELGDVIYQGKAWVSQVNPNSNYDDARRLSLVLDMTGAWPRILGS